jgi:hypothetical protein
LRRQLQRRVARPDQLPSCSYVEPGGATKTADPGIRLNAFANAFGDHGITTSICSNDYSDPLREFGAILRRMIGYSCLEGTLYAPNACDLALVTAPGTPAETSTPVPACNAAMDNRPCWHAVSDDPVCTPKTRIVVEHAVAPPADSAVIGSCRID